MSGYLLDKLVSSGVVAVIRRVDPGKVNYLANSLVKGGVSGLEITLDSKESIRKISELKDLYGERVIIGAGTVLNKHQAKESINAGADFIFAPTLDRSTIEYTKEKGKIMIPGVFTPTEMYEGYIWGADIVKVFPASVLGPQFIKDVKGPLNDIPVMPTGGINLDNIKDFLKAGAIAAGVGGSLVKNSLIERNEWVELEELAKSFVTKANKERWL
ncbi:bifunctional 4-hydroxy-2-oxoglutarate aldolase/2-dehydro-3-deoxy-phosphogluconate aldolase [Virgibacillus sp. CBA3643]|uniref:bifunctional 4-hydroxy-2-oxoglutarate aldolase/2-dehydro-3-deoxy-phosphogluconate aldolase n=1 Tax=Virgibacillus sp. CBA3643 TaxID=2942278 RepID=UPI0035A28F23